MCFGNRKARGFEVVADEFRKHPNTDILLPRRSDKMSAGYDFYAPCDIEVYPYQRVLIFSQFISY